MHGSALHGHYCLFKKKKRFKVHFGRDARFTLLQYNIQTSYSLSLDAILHAGVWKRCRHAGANVQTLTRSQQCGFHMVRSALSAGTSQGSLIRRQGRYASTAHLSPSLFLYLSLCGMRVKYSTQRGKSSQSVGVECVRLSGAYCSMESDDGGHESWMSWTASVFSFTWKWNTPAGN